MEMMKEKRRTRSVCVDEIAMEITSSVYFKASEMYKEYESRYCRDGSSLVLGKNTIVFGYISYNLYLCLCVFVFLLLYIGIYYVLYFPILFI